MAQFTLTLKQDYDGLPRQIKILDTQLKSHGDGMLAFDHATESFPLKSGNYFLKIEENGLESQHIPIRVDEDKTVDLTKLLADTAVLSGRRRSTSGEPRSDGALMQRRGALPATTRRSARRRLDDGAPVRPNPAMGRLREQLSQSWIYDPELPTRTVLAYQLYSWLMSRTGENLIRIEKSKGRLNIEIQNSLISDFTEFFDSSTGDNMVAPLMWLDHPFDQVGSVLALPAFGGSTEIETTQDHGGFEVVCRGSSLGRLLGTMLGYLEADIAVAPRKLAQMTMGDRQLDGEMAMEEAAGQFMQDKFLDPYAACVAGHFLTRIGKLEMMRDWSRNLADYFPFIADGCVIEGWRRLTLSTERGNKPWPEWRLKRPPPSSPRNPEPNAARPDDPLEDATRRFLEAHARGIPNFYFGCEKLLEGMMFCYDRIRNPELKEELERAVIEFSKLMKFTYSTAGLTTVKI